MTRPGVKTTTERPDVDARPNGADALSRPRNPRFAGAAPRRLLEAPRDPAAWQPHTATGVRNFRMMRVLERIATRFSDAGVPLMVLKGGALQLTRCAELDDRPMDDLDIMVSPRHADDAVAILESLGATASHALVRPDFFPRFHYETEFTIGTNYPIKIDLHVRPFRTLRYARTVPDEAFWSRAKTVRLGATEILIPEAGDMLIHLATHAAIHGLSRQTWVDDIARWLAVFEAHIDVEEVARSVRAWGLALPVRTSLESVNQSRDSVVGSTLLSRLRTAHVGWRGRLALRHAPHDAERPVRHVAVNALTTPDWRFVLAYLKCVLLPDRAHMADWYPQRHAAWLPVAHLLRWLGPLGPRRTTP